MKNKADSGKQTDGNRVVPRAFRSKSPLVAALSGTLLLFPALTCAPPSAAKGLPAKVVSILALKDSVKSLAEKLKDKDPKTAFNAARSLIRAKGKAVPELVNLLDDPKSVAYKRAIFVLNQLDWGGIGAKERKLAMDGVYPIIFRYENGERTRESLYAEAIMLRMGADALPYFTRMVRSPVPNTRMLGLSALAEVEWKHMPYAKVKQVIAALENMKKEPIEPLREVSQAILKRIRMTFVICQDDGAFGKAHPGGGVDGQKKAA